MTNILLHFLTKVVSGTGPFALEGLGILGKAVQYVGPNHTQIQK